MVDSELISEISLGGQERHRQAGSSVKSLAKERIDFSLSSRNLRCQVQHAGLLLYASHPVDTYNSDLPVVLQFASEAAFGLPSCPR